MAGVRLHAPQNRIYSQQRTNHFSGAYIWAFELTATVRFHHAVVIRLEILIQFRIQALARVEEVEAVLKYCPRRFCQKTLLRAWVHVRFHSGGGHGLNNAQSGLRVVRLRSPLPPAERTNAETPSPQSVLDIRLCVSA